MPTQTLPIQGLDTVGLIQDAPAVSLPPNAFSDALNVRFKDGAVRKMEGEINFLPGLFNDGDNSYDGTELLYILWWANPNRAPLSGYYLIIVRDGSDHLVQIVEPTGSTLNADEEIVYNWTRRTLYTFSGTNAVAGDYQHTFFQGGFAIVINNTHDTPIYIQDNDGNTEINDVPAGRELPGWDSYNVNEEVFSGTFNASQARTFDLGQEYAYGEWTITVAVTRGATTTTSQFTEDSNDPTNGVTVTTQNGVTSVAFTDAALIVDDTVTITVTSVNPVTVTAGVIRSFGDFLVAGNLVERDETQTGSPVLRNLSGVVRSSDVAPPGGIPTNWNPYAAGVSTADEFVITADGVVQDMVELQGNLYLYSNSSISVMRSTGNTTIPLAVSPVTNSYGCQSTGAVVEFDGAHVVVGSLDIYVFAGHPGSIRSLADARVRRSFYENLSPRHESRLFLLRYQQRDEIWICYPNSDSTTGNPNRALIWNYRGNTWTQRELTEVLAADFGPVPGGGLPETGATIAPTANQAMDTSGGRYDPRVNTATPGPDGGGSPGNNGVINIGAREVQTLSIDPDFVIPSQSLLARSAEIQYEIQSNIPSFDGTTDPPTLRFTTTPITYDADTRQFVDGTTTTHDFPLDGNYGADRVGEIAARAVSEIDALDGFTATQAGDETVPVGARSGTRALAANQTVTITGTTTRTITISNADAAFATSLNEIFSVTDRQFIFEAPDFRILIDPPTRRTGQPVFAVSGSDITTTVSNVVRVSSNPGRYTSGRVAVYEFPDAGVPGVLHLGNRIFLEDDAAGVDQTVSVTGTTSVSTATFNTGESFFNFTDNAGLVTWTDGDLTGTVNFSFILQGRNVRVGFLEGTVFTSNADHTTLTHMSGPEFVPDTSGGIWGETELIEYYYAADALNPGWGGGTEVFINAGGGLISAYSNDTVNGVFPVFRSLTGNSAARDDILAILNDAINYPGISATTPYAVYASQGRGVIFTEMPTWTARAGSNVDITTTTPVARYLVGATFDNRISRTDGLGEEGTFPMPGAASGNFTVTRDDVGYNRLDIDIISSQTTTIPATSHTLRFRRLGNPSLQTSDLIWPTVAITDADTGDVTEHPLLADGTEISADLSATNVMTTISNLIADDVGTERVYTDDGDTGVYEGPEEFVYLDREGWTNLEAHFLPGYSQNTSGTIETFMTIHEAEIDNPWNVEIVSVGNTGFDAVGDTGLLNFENTRNTTDTRVTPATTNDFRGEYLLRATPSYVAFRAVVEGDDRLIIVGTSSGTNDYSVRDQSGTNGELQSITSFIDDTVDQLNAMNFRFTAERVGDVINITLTTSGDSVDLIAEIVPNDAANIDRFNELLDMFPVEQRIGVTEPFINDGSTTVAEASIALNAVVGTGTDSQASPDATRRPDRTTRSVAPTITYDFSVVPTYSVDRPWATSQVNPNRQYPIMATSVEVNGNAINKIVAADIGYSKPSYLEAKNVTTIDQDTTQQVITAGTDDAPVPYTSYVERKQFAISPEFDTENLLSIALHAEGSQEAYLDGPLNYNKLVIRMQGSNAPGNVVDLSSAMADIQSNRENDFYISEDYKVDMRVHGRFLNMRVTDDAFDDTNIETYEGKEFNKETPWSVSMLQLDIGKGGTR